MKITFIPQRSDQDIRITKSGDILTVNGDVLDFSDIQEGGKCPAEAIENVWVVGSVGRLSGHIEISIILPYANPEWSGRMDNHTVVCLNDRIQLPAGREALEEKEDAAE